MSRLVKVGIVGVSGYTGGELARLLSGHPGVDITVVCGNQNAGKYLGIVFPSLQGKFSQTRIELFDISLFAGKVEVAFCALPHGTSATIVGELLDAGIRVLDLSADFRLRDAAVYTDWYGGDNRKQHPRKDLLAGAVYGLAEHYKDAIARTSLCAVPGCYPTASLLPLLPLLQRGLLSTEDIIIDAKSGMSGAGRNPRIGTMFCEGGEGVRAYAIAGQHRHTVEIEQEISIVCGNKSTIVFTPQVVPMARGILACIYAKPSRQDLCQQDLIDALTEAYAEEPFVHVLSDVLPATSFVRRSNHAHIAVRIDRRTNRIVIVCAIDNLGKGAAGQAVQCLNLMMGWPQTDGLLEQPAFP